MVRSATASFTIESEPLLLLLSMKNHYTLHEERTLLTGPEIVL